MTTDDTTCNCGCSTDPTPAGAEPCACGCECCEPDPATTRDEIDKLQKERAAIDDRLVELGAR